MKTVDIGKGYTASVDDEDYGLVGFWKWRSFTLPDGSVHACRRGKSSQGFMERLILGTHYNMFVYHADGNTLNNQRSNLRQCSRNQRPKLNQI